MRRFRLALQFLTILPVRIRGTVTETDIAGSSRFFIVVGILQGILILATEAFAGMVFHHDLVIGVVLLVLVLSNGGFHLDGLADTCDAIAVRGDRDRKLSVMKDSTIGPMGVIAIVFALALKYLALKNISHLLPFTYYAAILLLPVVPKWSMVVSLHYGTPAREDGLGKMFIGKTGMQDVIMTACILVALLAVPGMIFSRQITAGNLLFTGCIVGMTYLFSRIAILFFKKQFGGLTGDTFGAVSEITEVLFLATVIVWSRLFI